MRLEESKMHIDNSRMTYFNSTGTINFLQSRDRLQRFFSKLFAILYRKFVWQIRRNKQIQLDSAISSRIRKYRTNVLWRLEAAVLQPAKCITPHLHALPLHRFSPSRRSHRHAEDVRCWLPSSPRVA